jgi:hypothetical protein
MTALPIWTGAPSYPGITAAVESVENNFKWGRVIDEYISDAMISGAARDVGNTGTTSFLRPGLLMGKITATELWKEWSPTATDGSEVLRGINTIGIEVSPNGVDTNRFWCVMTWGTVATGGLIVPGVTASGLSGTDLEYAAAHGLQDVGFRLDTPYASGFGTHVAIAATSTLTFANAGKTITDYGASGATELTIPDPVPGVTWRFINHTANVRTISPASTGLIIADNDATADDVALGGIGSTLELVGVKTGASTYKYQVLTSTDATPGT